jgi:hypothetical protein
MFAGTGTEFAEGCRRLARRKVFHRETVNLHVRAVATRAVCG